MGHTIMIDDAPSVTPSESIVTFPILFYKHSTHSGSCLLRAQARWVLVWG